MPKKAKRRSRLDDVRLGYLLLCNAGVNEAGKHTYYGVFDRITAEKFPCVHPKMHVAIELIGPANEESEVGITFRDNDGNDVLPPPKKMQIRFSPYGGAHIGIDINGLRFPKEGFYSFAVWQGRRLVGDRMLFVERTKD